jgi:hypothetical protein
LLAHSQVPWQWIPAFAGMTVWEKSEKLIDTKHWFSYKFMAFALRPG